MQEPTPVSTDPCSAFPLGIVFSRLELSPDKTLSTHAATETARCYRNPHPRESAGCFQGSRYGRFSRPVASRSPTTCRLDGS
jgi:hypothetical protein